MAMVQTREQYILLHRAVRELFKERLKVIDAHPYENIATDGTPLIVREKESDYEELYMRPEKQGVCVCVCVCSLVYMVCVCL